ncbi:MAG: DUF4105 domain-containing protein [Candidatus Krumholzibacteria bacterium]|nr:DUF4105 domain-containing protein [Candidatus Krumholzibacteria bacterium]
MKKRVLRIVGLLALATALIFVFYPARTDRDWITAHAVTPQVTIDGDHVIVEGVRNFRFSADAPPTGSFETREFDLSRLQTLWYGLSVFHPDGWRGPAHGFFSFGFDDGTFIAVSVEARKEKGEPYGVYRGLLRTFELIYIVGDERDLLLDRAAYRPDDVYLFPIEAPVPGIRDLFVSMLTEADKLGRDPAWYNTLTDNCTSRLRDHVNDVAPGLVPPTWRVVLPGYTDELMIKMGRLRSGEDLTTARDRWWINDRARAAGDTPDFSRAVRDTAWRKTEVFVLGMIHGGHRTSETWGLDQVRETIRAIDPDVVCPEIPPANWPGALATWQEKQVVEDSRVKVFPEYVDVLLPLTDELDFVVEPSAGWTPEMAVARRARMQLFETSAEDSVAAVAYDRDEQWVQGWLAEHPAPAPDDDPFYIHSPAYDLRTKIELGPYEYHLNDVIGPPGGWTHINGEHFALIADAIRRHPGQRVLVTFGAGHKYWFLEQLRNMPEVELVDVRPFLPGGAKRSSSVTEAAVEELLQGFDGLCAWWSPACSEAGGAWAQFESRMDLTDGRELLASLLAGKGQHQSPFHDGPFLGTVEILGQEEGQVHLRAEVRRLGDSAAAAEWLTATLVADSARPGGFAWVELQLPIWLLKSAD